MILRCPHCRSAHLLTSDRAISFTCIAVIDDNRCGGWMEPLTDPAEIDAALKEAGKLIAERLEAHRQ